MTRQLTKTEQDELQNYFVTWLAGLTPQKVTRLIERFECHIADAQGRLDVLRELRAEMERSGADTVRDLPASSWQRYGDACDESWFLRGGLTSEQRERRWSYEG